MTYKEALEKNESREGLTFSEISLSDLLTLIDDIPGWDYPLAKDSITELAKRAGIDANDYFKRFESRDYSDLYLSAIDNLNL